MRIRIVLLSAMCAWLGLQTGTSAQEVEEPDFRVTLLGTGGPPPDPDRFGPATLVEAGNQKLLFDVGRGTPIRLWQVRVPLRAINATFVTHLHSDHVVGIPDVWLSGWLGGPSPSARLPFRWLAQPAPRN